MLGPDFKSGGCRLAATVGSTPTGFRQDCLAAIGRRYNREMTAGEYIEHVAGTRVSLDSIVYAFRAGESPEAIRQNFASLTLEQVYGAIAFYLGHQPEVDANLRAGEEEFDRSVPPLSQTKPELYERLQRAREQITKGT